MYAALKVSLQYLKPHTLPHFVENGGCINVWGINQGLHHFEWHIIMTHYTSSQDLILVHDSAPIRLPQASAFLRSLDTQLYFMELPYVEAERQQINYTQEHSLYVKHPLCYLVT